MSDGFELWPIREDSRVQWFVHNDPSSGGPPGWEDSVIFWVLLDGLGTGTKDADVVEIGNMPVRCGVQPLGADFVGFRVRW
jgi:hypothetical protein